MAWSAEDFKKRGIDSPKLDAELLVAHALGVDRIDLYLDLDRPLTEDERLEIRALIARRQKREPVAYILGHRDFYGRRFEVDARVLIPRPDTETLVQAALERLPEQEEYAVADLCTGSGIIAITLSCERPSLKVHATDLSADALALARANADRHQVLERVSFFEGDLFDAVPSTQRFSIVVANPPYVCRSDHATLSPEVRDHEPSMALVGGDDGLELCRRIVEQAAGHMADQGWLIMEVGEGQADGLKADGCWKAEWTWEQPIKDLNGIARVVALQRR